MTDQVMRDGNGPVAQVETPVHVTAQAGAGVPAPVPSDEKQRGLTK